jgi:hypothetical protein
MSGELALRARANYGDRVATVALLVGAIVGSARDRDPVDVGRVHVDNDVYEDGADTGLPLFGIKLIVSIGSGCQDINQLILCHHDLVSAELAGDGGNCDFRPQTVMAHRMILEPFIVEGKWYRISTSQTRYLITQVGRGVFSAIAHTNIYGPHPVSDSILYGGKCSVLKIDIRPAGDPHLIQLAFHRGGLILQRGKGFPGLLISAAKREPLQYRRPETEEASYSQSYGNYDKPPGYSYEWGLVGSLVIGAGAVLLGFTMELGYKAFEIAVAHNPGDWAGNNLRRPHRSWALVCLSRRLGIAWTIRPLGSPFPGRSLSLSQ